MNERQVFEGALEFSRWQDRQAFLDKACVGNPALRKSVEELLAAHESRSEFLNTPAIDQLQGQHGPKSGHPTAFFDSNADTPEHAEDFSTDSTPQLQAAKSPGAIGRLGHYEVLQELGSGAFGIVYRAFDEKLHRQVAIKALNAQLAATSPPRKRFLREARAVAAIKNENIVQIYSVEEVPFPYLVMEFVQGQTLQQKLDGNGPLDIEEILHLSRQMATGLAAAHAQGLIHRDIKPGNILLEQGVEQKVKITDFGLARAADDASITRTGTIAGTPLYMSPEQAMGQALDARSDLFSLGAVIYQMATGRAAFRAPNTIAVLRRVIEDTPRDMIEVIPQVPGWLVTIVGKLMEKDPNRRYQSAKEVADLFTRCQSELLTSGRVDCVPGVVAEQKSSSQPRKGRWSVLKFGFISAIAIVAVGLLMLTTARPLFSVPSESQDEIVGRDESGGERQESSEDQPARILDTRSSTSAVLSPDQGMKRPDVGTPAEKTPVSDPNPPVATWPEDAPKIALAPFDSKQAAEHQQAWAKYLKVPVEYTNLMGMKFRLIPPGEFLMGSSSEEIFAAERIHAGDTSKSTDSVRSEGPQHKVLLTQPVYLSVTELTQDQFHKVVGRNQTPLNGSRDEPKADQLVKGENTGAYPVESLRWFDAVEFCNKLSQREGASTSYSRFGSLLEIDDLPGYRLPFEAEWEFACRAGTATPFITDVSNVELSTVAWTKVNAEGSKRPVAKLAPNSFGLYDMSGNVAEWVNDRWDPTHYQQNSDRSWIDPKGPAAETGHRVVRGGTFLDDEMFCRSGSRLGIDPGASNNAIGFRIALPVKYVQQQLENVPYNLQDLQSINIDFAAQRRLATEVLKYNGASIALTNNVGIQVAGLLHGQQLPDEDFIVSRIGLPNLDLTDDAVSFLSMGSHLRHLNLEGNPKITEMALEHLKSIRTLEVLSLNGTSATSNLAKYLNSWPLLKNLMISGGISGHGSVSDNEMFKMRLKPYLKRLDIRNTAITNSGLQAIIDRCPNLESIEISGQDVGSDSQRSLKALFGLKHLHSLTVSGSQLTLDGLAVLKALPRIRTLHVKVPVTDEGLRVLGASELKVDQLILESSSHTNLPAEHRVLPALAGMEFQELEMHGYGGSLTDEDLLSLAERRNLRKFNLMSATGASTDHPEERQLYTPAGIAALRRLRPDLTLNIDSRLYPQVKLYPKDKNSLAVSKWELPEGAPKPAVTPFSVEDAASYQQAWADYVKQPVEIQNSIGMNFRMLPAGEFQTYIWGQGQAGPSAGDAVRFRLTQPYYLGKTEVTFAEFRQFVEETGYVTSMESKSGWAAINDENGVVVFGQNVTWREPGKYRHRDNDPVTMVSHADATAFCEWLTKKEKVTYRLPTEAEWMQGSHAGGEYLFGFVEDPQGLEPYEWDRSAVSMPLNETSSPLHPVGTKKPNPFGLYDMLGNVREYARDRLAIELNTISPIDPVGNPQPIVAACGGAWQWPYAGLLASARGWSEQGTQDTGAYQGFRVLREVPGAKPLPSWFEGALVTKSGPSISPHSMVPQPTPIAGLRSWSIETRFHRGRNVHDIQWSPTGERIATVAELDSDIRIWRADGTLEKILSGAIGELRNLAFSPDGKLLASTSVRLGESTPIDELLIWEVATGRLKASLPAHSKNAAVSFSPNGKFIAFTIQWLDHTRGACVLDIESGRCSYFPGNRGDNASSVAWAPDNHSIAVGHESGVINVWKLNDSVTPLVMKRNSGENDFRHRSLAWSPNQQWIASWFGGNTIRLWDAASGEIVRDITVQDQGHVGLLRWSRDNRRILIRDGHVSGWRIVDSADGSVLMQSETPAYAVTANWSPDESEVVVADYGHGGTLRFVDATTGKTVRSGESLGGGYPQPIYSRPPGGDFVTISNGYQLGWFDTQTGELTQDVNLPESTHGQVNWSPDGLLQGICFVYQGRETPTILDGKTGERRSIRNDKIEPSQSKGIRRSSWASDSQHIALSMVDGKVEIWDTRGGQLVRVFDTGSKEGWDIFWSPDGTKLATLGGDRIVRIWDPWTGSLLSTAPEMEDFQPGAGYQTFSWRLAWTQDSRFLWIGAATQVYKYDTVTGKFDEVVGLSNGSHITSIGLSPDNERLLAHEHYSWTMMKDFSHHSTAPVGNLQREYSLWMPDSRRIISIGIEKTDLLGFDVESKQRLGTLLPSLQRRNEGRRWLCVGPTGHYRGSEDINDHIVYVALSEDGTQTMFTPSEFAETFKWKNDPSKATFMKPLN